MKLSDVKGLEPEFRNKICGVGNKDRPRCGFLRYVKYNGELYLVCGKGTASGLRHAERLKRLSAENPDGKLGDMEIIAADNCSGRAGEFAHLLPEKAN